MASADVGALFDAARQGDRSATARLLSVAERGDTDALRLESLLPAPAQDSIIIGVTGPPGAGKSSLIDRLLGPTIADRGRTAVLAVDPSSPYSDGAILGDRIRMRGTEHGDRAFIRSMASRGAQGGLAVATGLAARVLTACGWSVVLIETLGIGQVELDIVEHADLVMVVLNPGWGDSIQANKAGITEAGDLFIINKCDRPGAQRARMDLEESLQLLQRAPKPAIVDTIAAQDQGTDAAWQALLAAYAALRDSGELADRRERQVNSRYKRLLLQQLQNHVGQALGSDEGAELMSALRADRDFGSALTALWTAVGKRL